MMAKNAVPSPSCRLASPEGYIPSWKLDFRQVENNLLPGRLWGELSCGGCAKDAQGSQENIVAPNPTNDKKNQGWAWLCLIGLSCIIVPGPCGKSPVEYSFSGET